MQGVTQALMLSWPAANRITSRPRPTLTCHYLNRHMHGVVHHHTMCFACSTHLLLKAGALSCWLNPRPVMCAPAQQQERGAQAARMANASQQGALPLHALTSCCPWLQQRSQGQLVAHWVPRSRPGPASGSSTGWGWSSMD